MRNLSPLRYPGSKRKLVKYINKILVHNKFSPRILVEPFAGGGSVFLHFLINNKVDKVVIADKDELIYSFWRTLFYDSSYLVNFIKKVKVNLENFDYYRNIASNVGKFKRRSLAEACLFLNRTSFSGILNDSAGPIGGRKQESDYKIDCRFGRKNLIQKVKQIAALRDKVVVLSCNWADTLKYPFQKLKYKSEEVLFYFDPPFYKKANHLYRHYFNDKNHEDLRDVVIKLKQPWILSYDRAREIEKLYSGFKSVHIQMPYSINSPAKRLEKELIITRLKIPTIRNKA
jgi:DNA adenine methylase